MTHSTQERRRIKILETSLPEPILTVDGHELGVFLPGLTYTITEHNAHVVKMLLDQGRAVLVDSGRNIASQPSDVSGQVEIK
jgi:hypothetical protein